MPVAGPRRILIVANRTAATPTLLEEVRRRVAERPCVFSLLIPDARGNSDWTLDLAFPPPLVQLKVGQPTLTSDQ